MFIVIDAIDGAGKGRQRLELVKYLRTRKLQVESIEFPFHDSFYQTLIHPALQGETKMNKSSWVLAYLLDKTLHADLIRPYLGDPKKFLIADGYLTTTIAYQSFLMEQVSMEKLLSYGKEFEIPVPDLAIYLDVKPEVARNRKQKEDGHEEGPDMFEKSIEKQRKLSSIFRKMVKDQVYCKWEQADGNGDVAEVTANITAILNGRKLI
jgi:thymidylate kinase